MFRLTSSLLLLRSQPSLEIAKPEGEDGDEVKTVWVGQDGLLPEGIVEGADCVLSTTEVGVGAVGTCSSCSLGAERGRKDARRDCVVEVGLRRGGGRDS